MIYADIKIFGKGNKQEFAINTKLESKLDNEIILRELWSLKESFNRMFELKMDIQLTETNSLTLEPPKDKK